MVTSRDVHNYYDRKNWLLYVSESVPYLLAESSRSRTDPCHQSTQHWYNVEFQNRRPTRFLYNTIDTPADPRKDTDPICVLISGPISVCWVKQLDKGCCFPHLLLSSWWISLPKKNSNIRQIYFHNVNFQTSPNLLGNGSWFACILILPLVLLRAHKTCTHQLPHPLILNLHIFPSWLLVLLHEQKTCFSASLAP